MSSLLTIAAQFVTTRTARQLEWGATVVGLIDTRNGEAKRLRLLERAIETADRRLVLLAPAKAHVPETFRKVLGTARVHARLLQDVQHLRGRVYLEDGAVDAAQLCAKGLHKAPEDEQSWHLVSLNASGEAIGCVWYRLHGPDVSFEDLRVRNCPLLGIPSWHGKLWGAIETDLLRARTAGLGYAELGGLAIDKANRRTSEILLLVIAAYSLSRALGGALCLTTATVRNSSAQILRRLGGGRLQISGEAGEIPPYFDPNYGCTMELLRFDSRAHLPDLACGIDLMEQKLAAVPVLLNDPPAVTGATHGSTFHTHAAA